jgi:hypothetical protein
MDRRFLLAMALIMAILFGPSLLSKPDPSEQLPAGDSAAVTLPGAIPDTGVPPAPAVEAVPGAVQDTQTSRVPVDTVVVSSNL